MHTCMDVYIKVSNYACIHFCMYVVCAYFSYVRSLYACMNLCMHLCLYVCMHACMYVWMKYVCTYVYVCTNVM